MVLSSVPLSFRPSVDEGCEMLSIEEFNEDPDFEAKLFKRDEPERLFLSERVIFEEYTVEDEDFSTKPS